MSNDDLEILDEFVQESREHLAAIEPDLLEMERGGSSTASDIVNRVFRAIHSTKGGAAFLAFGSLKEFSHVMESVLMLIRDGRLEISPEVIDALLKGVDVLRRMIDDVRASDSIDCAYERGLLDAILAMETTAGAGASVDGAARRAPVGTASPSLDVTGHGVLLQDLLAHGQRLFRVAVRCHADLGAKGSPVELVEPSFAGIARVIQRRAPRVPMSEADSLDPVFEWEIATVLDHRLLAAATGLPERCLTLITRDADRTFKGDEVLLSASKTPVASPPMQSSTLAPESLPREVPERAHGGGQTASPSRTREQQNEGNDTLRVRVELLNRLMDSASELVLGRNQLLRALKEQSGKSAGLDTILQHIDRVTTDLQEGIMQTRMQQVGTLFGRFARVARDLGRQLGKNVELRAEGNHVELDKSIIEALVDPLTHIVRNAVDHGLEAPDERRSRRKPEVGKILLSASHESGQVKIAIEDDGRGINRAEVLRIAVERGLLTATAAEKVTDRDVVNLLMRPGFSTAERVSDVSGRGVGMDVVRNNVEALGGQIEIDSEFGLGTCVRLRLPLTLAIIPSLIVGAAGERFAVPQASIVELVWIRQGDAAERIQRLQGAPMLRLRERLVPLVKVDRVLSCSAGSDAQDTNAWESESDQEHYILLLRTGTDHYGLVVDELFESEEIVVKPLPQFLKGIECFAGTTILGDGSVTMILDPSGVAARAGLQFATSEVKAAEAEAQRQGSTTRRSVILFAGSPTEQYIVPQEQVLRLERVDRASLQRAGGKDYICYRGLGLPLIRLEDFLPVSGVPDFAQEVFLLIPRMGRGRAAEPKAGILVWKILDALDLELNLQASLFDGPGVRGATLLDGILTTFIDPVAFIEAASPNKERAA